MRMFFIILALVIVWLSLGSLIIAFAARILKWELLTLCPKGEASLIVLMAVFWPVAMIIGLGHIVGILINSFFDSSPLDKWIELVTGVQS